MKLVNTKFQSDGSKLQKIESFTASEQTSGFYKNDVKVDDIIERFNLNLEEQDWLSLRPQGSRYYKWDLINHFGELNADNKLHGRGFRISLGGNINIQYWNNGRDAPGRVCVDILLTYIHSITISTGNYIYITRHGDVEVGEKYLKDGK